MVVWLLLGAYCLASLSTLALTGRNEAASRAAAAAYRHGGVNAWPAGCLVMVCGWSVAVMWTVYAVHVDDWRFGAIGWLPVVTNLAVKVLTARIPGRNG